MTSVPARAPATPSPEPVLKLVENTAGDFPRLRKVEADAAIERARVAVAESRLSDAATAYAEALRKHPGLQYLYREVGMLLADQGLNKAAESCYRGVLPEFISAEWFAKLPASSPAQDKHDDTGSGNTRHVCHEPRTRPLRQPKGITPPVDQMFQRDTMTSSLATVESAAGGSLWFDGFNRVMLDIEGRIVDQLTRGNPALIVDVMQQHSPQHISGRAFFVGNRGFSNYYHWILDILPSLALFQKAGYTFTEDDYVVVYSNASRFQKTTLEHLGFPADRVIEMGSSTPWVSADEMVVPCYLNSMGLTVGDWIPEFLQRAFIDNAPVGARDALPTASKLYLARAKNARNGRSIGNESELIAFLELRGFTVVYPENYTVFEQAGLFANAEVILAAHGAGLTNIVFCNPGTKIIELYGNFMATCYWAISEVCGLDYYNHCCSTEETSVHYHQRSQKDLSELRQRGFSVDINQLDGLLATAGCD